MSKAMLINKFKKYISVNKNEFVKKSKDSVRILSFNVNNWTNVDNKYTINEIFDLINESDADIVGLNEAMFFGDKSKKDFNLMLEDSKYKYVEMCNNRYGINILMSRYPITYQKVISLGKDPIKKLNRYALKCTIDIGKKKPLNILLTHLDVFDETEDTRLAQITSIIEKIDTTYLIMGDLNSLRKDDYTDKEWKLLVDNDKKRCVETQTKVTDYIESNDFKITDSCYYFSVSVWSMRRVDYIYIGTTFPHNISDTNLYVTDTSDHLPIYVDVS
jgi:endonuclease/exonuclease/phosphatase family metal-dependent hydrolase